MNIQWYPGHMTKAKRMMEENIKLIDLVIELLDARIPVSSKNPDIDELAKGKARLVILNKSDLADEKSNREWIEYYKSKGINAIAINSRTRGFQKQVNDAILKSCEAKIQRDLKRGIKNKPIRAMIAGIPNVGKSTFINTLSGKAAAKTGNKPGVTKGKQWIRIANNIEFLDTPGILWPKFDEEIIGEHIAFIGSVNEEIIDLEELSVRLIECIRLCKPNAIAEKYNVDENEKGYDVLKAIAISRNCLVKGGEPDTKRASKLLLDDYKDGRLGRITLEKPGQD